MPLFAVERFNVSAGKEIIVDWGAASSEPLGTGRKVLEYDGIKLPITITEDRQTIIVHLGEAQGDLGRVILFDENLATEEDEYYAEADKLNAVDTNVRVDLRYRDMIYIRSKRGEGGLIVEAYKQGGGPQVDTMMQRALENQQSM
jgi:hypothetical protein